MDLPDRGGPLGGRWVDGGGRSRRRRAPRRRGLRWRSDFCAPVASDRSWVAGQLRKDQRELLVVLVGRKGGWLRRIAPELSGGQTGRSWRGWSSPVNLLLGELYGEGLMSPECSERLGVPFK